ncbi:hypothetical protein ACFPYJ_12095 [Paenibacillus solisilvae]|uniref:Uncharacterized protein n=1 Tax=Paenibacillus solisilvae TaxID=2486751 RepID=A0ABW0VW67_9BACL
MDVNAIEATFFDTHARCLWPCGVRAVTELLGVDVSWNGEVKKVFFYKYVLYPRWPWLSGVFHI